jgi:hypothetical protein
MNNDDLKKFIKQCLYGCAFFLILLGALKLGIFDGVLKDGDNVTTVKVEKPVVEKVEAPKKVEKVEAPKKLDLYQHLIETPRVPRKGATVYFNISKGEYPYRASVGKIKYFYTDGESCLAAMFNFENWLKPKYGLPVSTKTGNDYVKREYNSTFTVFEKFNSGKPDIIKATCYEWLPQKGVTVYYNISKGDYTGSVNKYNFKNMDSCTSALYWFEMGLKDNYRTVESTNKQNDFIKKEFNTTFTAKETYSTNIPDIIKASCDE